MSRKKKKYYPIQIPRKNPGNTPEWFEILRRLNIYSIEERENWQEKGARTVSGWAVKNPKGNLLPSTFSVCRKTAMKRCLNPAMQRFNGIIPSLFSDWHEHGYELVKVKWTME